MSRKKTQDVAYLDQSNKVFWLFDKANYLLSLAGSRTLGFEPGGTDLEVKSVTRSAISLTCNPSGPASLRISTICASSMKRRQDGR